MARVSEGRVVVTGASRGIGRAVVTALAARGARVAAVARDRDALDALAAEAEGVTPIVADVGDPGACDAIVEGAAEALSGLDGVVSAAGIVRYQPVGAITERDLRAQLDVNLVAPILLAQSAARVMRAQGTAGAIVNVASTIAMRPAPSTIAYAATKGGLVAATRGLALELAPDRIRVNAVAPGVIDTDMVRALRLAPGEAEPTGEERERRVRDQIAHLAKLHPLGRIGRADEVADAIVHLLDAEWTTGEVLVVDGGLLAS